MAPVRREGLRGRDAGTTDRDGFIAPSIGRLDHALFFTSAPSVLDKARQVLDQGRLTLPGAVVVWDETAGRRKGANAVANAWWAGQGSLTVAFADARGGAPAGGMGALAAAVLRSINSFAPQVEAQFRAPNDVVLDGKKLGNLSIEDHGEVRLSIVRINCCTDFAKAPPTIAANAARLVDYIDIASLPLANAGTLPNTLLTRLMDEVPQ